MTPFFIGIAGGSGTGKTALARGLKKYFGKKASVLHMDNYQRFNGGVPKIAGIKNWDHPKAIKWGKLLKDLNALKRGEELKIIKKNIFAPKEIIIVEGYLLFCKRSIRKLLDFLIYLKASEKARIKRRTKFKNNKYIQKILLPMHCKYIEPTKQYADLILDTEKYSIKQCCRQIIERKVAERVIF